VFALQADIELFVVVIDLLVLAPREERLPAQQHVEDSSERKHVAGWLDVLAAGEVDDLRSDVAGSAAPEEYILFLVDVGGKAEVDDHWLAGVTSQHDVLGLYIAMHYSALVHMLQPLQKTANDPLNLILSEPSFSVLNSLEQGLSSQ
jgi:hypothetical protein